MGKKKYNIGCFFFAAVISIIFVGIVSYHMGLQKSIDDIELELYEKKTEERVIKENVLYEWLNDKKLRKDVENRLIFKQRQFDLSNDIRDLILSVDSISTFEIKERLRYISKDMFNLDIED